MLCSRLLSCSSRYRLSALYHSLGTHEGSFSGGHYIAYVRLAEQWYRMSDSQVTRVDEEAVLRKQAFMLFYERE